MAKACNRDSALCKDDESSPPVATRGTNEQQFDGKQNGSAPKVKTVTGSNESASNNKVTLPARPHLWSEKNRWEERAKARSWRSGEELNMCEHGGIAAGKAAGVLAQSVTCMCGVDGDLRKAGEPVLGRPVGPRNSQGERERSCIAAKEDMAESLLLPVVHGVIGKAANALVQSVTRMCSVDGDRGKLERQLLLVQCRLADAEEKSETNPAVKLWMKELKAVAYEADDVLDEFQYEALRREAVIAGSKSCKVLDCFTSLLFRATMSKKLNNVLKKINELVEEMNKFGLVERSTEVPVPRLPYRQTHSALDESVDILGREEDKEMVVKLLLVQHEKHKLQVLPIIGMGGLGKTTFAKMVYNDTRVKEHFQLKMWHCVSDKFEVGFLLKSIIELVTERKCELTDTIELLRRELQKVIGKKRFLLVLDDVWSEEKNLWEDVLKPILSSAGGDGSVILVTTRSQHVASIMGTLESHQLSCLSDDDSWDLFSRKAFYTERVQEQTELVTIGKLIVKKCKGLPLALKAMGGLMSSKQKVKQWETIARSNIGDSVKGEDGILPILKLSYTHLPSEMKQCFAFCSVFPKDYEMDKEVLIQLWMANGFIQEEQGEDVFNTLVSRSFLQDVKVKAIVYCLKYEYESIFCRMHDLMHDLAKDVADECTTSTLEQLIQKEASITNARHMHISYIHFRTLDSEKIGVFKGISYLHTLIAPPLSQKDLNELRLVSLRAIILQGSYFDYTDQVINSKHIRHLDLSESFIASLPNSICKMYNLQTLRLIGCSYLKYLPEDMGKMKKLVHLYLLGCDRLVRMPPNFSLLNNLRILTTFVVDIEAGRGIEELKDLHHLANRLELYNLRYINSRKSGKEANLHQKKNLNELILHWDSPNMKFWRPPNDADNEEVLESLAPHSELQVLEVHSYNGLRIPRWMSDPQRLRWLRTLGMYRCPGCKDLSTLWLSVSLERLILDHMNNLTTLCKNVEAEECSVPRQIFSKLKYMKLYCLSNFEKWAENTAGEANNLVTFPKLEVLEITICTALLSVPHCPGLKKLRTSYSGLRMSSLTHLTILSKLKYDGPEDYVCVSIFVTHEDEDKPRVPRKPLEYGSNYSSATQIARSSSCFTRRGCFPTVSVFDDEFLPTVQQTRAAHCFFSIVCLGLWKCFSYVEDLQLSGCDDLVYWPTEQLRSLIHLRSLCIESCHKFKGKGSSSEEMPHLEKLEIRFLLEIPEMPPSLEDLCLDYNTKLVALPSNLGDLDRLENLELRCERLVALPSNLGNLGRLEKLKLSCCDDLKELPNGMDRLTSLKRLEIWWCPKIKKLPQGLLKRLPTLEFLSVKGNPELQRLFTESGEYFHLISSVPQIELEESETELRPNPKKLVKRFLPYC
uniref:NB-ARC domain-containing protein n=1 Tax=Leersia perrieri TaxID=77586 RepID=A0A0D9XAE6_9ORYZ